MSYVEFPVVLHVRCTAAMLQEVRERGGGRWVRSLITANTRLPLLDGETPAAVPPPPAAVTRKAIAKVTRADPGARKRKVSRRDRRVTVDKRKRRRV